MDLMAQYPDKYFDLAIVDPPYGGGNHSLNNFKSHGKRVNKYGKNLIWDIAPTREYFNELFRISKQQIIWGGNHFSLPAKKNFIIFNKLNVPENLNLSQCEYAWTNIKGNSKIFKYFPKIDPNRFHPTQKPVALYKWLLQKYAKSDWKILDTHFGSGSLAVACNELGFQLTASEIDKDYFNAACKRIEQAYNEHKNQPSLLPDTAGHAAAVGELAYE
jgi:site-specific DNA-methyltransferase (adenine-specific)